MPASFALVDLLSQREAVRYLLRDMSPEPKIAWLAAHGTIRTIEFPGARLTYVFESRLGLTASFFFDDHDDFVFVGDHHTFK